MEKFVLEAKNLTKDFDGFVAVDNISFMMLLGLIKPTSGQIKIFGLDFWQNREKILNLVNFSSAYTFLPGRLTVFENLYVFAYLYGIPHPSEKIKKLLENLELVNLKDQPTESLSSGEATRLNLCKALINDPRLLFLDRGKLK